MCRQHPGKEWTGRGVGVGQRDYLRRKSKTGPWWGSLHGCQSLAIMAAGSQSACWDLGWHYVSPVPAEQWSPVAREAGNSITITASVVRSAKSKHATVKPQKHRGDTFVRLAYRWKSAKISIPVLQPWRTTTLGTDIVKGNILFILIKKNFFKKGLKLRGI